MAKTAWPYSRPTTSENGTKLFPILPPFPDYASIVHERTTELSGLCITKEICERMLHIIRLGQHG